MRTKRNSFIQILVLSCLVYHCCSSEFQSEEESSDIPFPLDLDSVSLELEDSDTSSKRVETTTTSSPETEIGNRFKVNVQIKPLGKSGVFVDSPKYRYNDDSGSGSGSTFTSPDVGAGSGPVRFRNQLWSSFGHPSNNRRVHVDLSIQGNGIRKISINDIDSSFVTPPPHDNVAQMARYIVSVSNWTSIASISTREPTVGFPFVNIVSLSDGPAGKSTGVPYMYVTGLDVSTQDLKKDARASLTMSLAQSDYCLSQEFDPEDPRCGRVILTGRFVKLQNGTTEASFARQAVFSRHPVMSSWPLDHGFFFAKLDIFNILVLDYFGGAKSVTPKDYFKAKIFT